MPTSRVLRDRQPRAEHGTPMSSAKAIADGENRVPNHLYLIDPSPVKEINFSRKRPLTATRASDTGALNTEHNSEPTRTPKRVRSNQQLNTDNVGTPPIVQTLRAQRKHASPSPSLSRRHASNPGRNSKFKEASMHDRVSDKPPSMFMRVFSNDYDHGAQGVEQLMEDYHNGSPVRWQTETRPDKTPRPVTRQTQLAGLTHHANASISKTSTNTTGTTDSGIYRFGRSIASAFNPLKAWKSMQRSFKTTEEELARENLQKAAEAEEAERQAKIQVAYDELKRSGRIPTKTILRNQAYKDDKPGDRDSGVQLSSARSSADMRASFYDDDEDTQELDANVAERPESRKAAFHIRRPSLNDLKNLPSHVNLSLPRRPSFSMLGERTASWKHDDDYAQFSVSKKNLAKQQKLTKQVSNLEAKLEKAKGELQNAMTEVKPLPRLPAEPEATPPKKSKTPRKSLSITKNTRSSMQVPGLESIPSERFLLKKGPAESSSDLSFKCQGNSQQQQQPIFEPELMTTEEKRHSASDCSFLNDPSDDEADAEATPKPRRDAMMTDLAVVQMAMLGTPQSGKKRANGHDAVGSLTKQARRTNGSRQARDETKLYQPTPESIEDGEVWNRAVKAKSNKKKRTESGPQTTRSATASTDLAEANDASSDMEPVAGHFSPPASGAAESYDASITADALEFSLNRPLSMVLEETASITKSIAVTLNAEPEKPTAVKTPAAFPSRVTRSRAAGSLDKGAHKRGRSQSPPPSSDYSKSTYKDTDEVKIAPDGKHVPPMPDSSPTTRRAEKSGPDSDFQWPEDCF